MTIGDRVKFETNGGWYNSGIIKDMDENSCLIKVDTLGNPDSIVPLPYYVSGPHIDFITECERKKEDENMTNYEWLIKNNAELVKGILSHHLSKEKGIPKQCSDIDCRDCDFDWNSNSLEDCRINTEKWLEEEREPLYKKGDIVIDPFKQIKIIAEDYYEGDFIKVSYYADHSVIIESPATSIKKKVGHIDESTDDPSLCASCKSKECILQTGVVREHCDFYKAESEEEI